MSVLNSKFLNNNILALSLLLSQAVYFTPMALADGSVRLAGQVLFVNKAAAGGMTADQRAETIQKNLDNALVAVQEASRTPSSVNIVYVKGLPVITFGGYQVATVDAENAKLAGTTPALLAQKWADSLRGALKDKASIDSYVAQLTGTYPGSAPVQDQGAAPVSQMPIQQAPMQQQAPQGSYAPAQYNQGYNNQDNFNRATYPPQGQMQRGRVIYAPAGLVLPVTLNTSISTNVAQMGDLIQATISQPVMLGDGQVPSGSVLIGQITSAKAGGFLGRSGMLGVKFNRLRTPDGVETPITAHIVGGIGKYAGAAGAEGDVYKGETWKNKVGQGALRTGIGAGAGAALGTAVGAIAGGGHGAGRGAWSGTAIGGGLGLADSLILRKGKDVKIQAGQNMQVQLDSPASIGTGGNPNTGAF